MGGWCVSLYCSGAAAARWYQRGGVTPDGGGPGSAHFACEYARALFCQYRSSVTLPGTAHMSACTPAPLPMLTHMRVRASMRSHADMDTARVSATSGAPVVLTVPTTADAARDATSARTTRAGRCGMRVCVRACARERCP